MAVLICFPVVREIITTSMALFSAGNKLNCSARPCGKPSFCHSFARFVAFVAISAVMLVRMFFNTCSTGFLYLLRVLSMHNRSVSSWRSNQWAVLSITALIVARILSCTVVGTLLSNASTSLYKASPLNKVFATT